MCAGHGNCRKGTLAGVSAHLCTLILALFLSGCGFSGALYLPEEAPAAARETPAPEDTPASQESPAPQETPAPDSAGDQAEVPQP